MVQCTVCLRLPDAYQLLRAQPCFLPQSALTLKPTFTDAYNNMASALVQKGCIPQAMECYAAALRIDPNVVSR